MPELLWIPVALGLAASVALLAVRGSSWAALAVIATVPIQRELAVGAGGHELTLTQLFLGAFIAGALLRFIAGHMRIPLDASVILLAATCSLYGLSLIHAPSVTGWAGETYRWLVPLIALILFRPYLRGVSLDRLLLLLAASIGLCAAWSAAQIIQDDSPTSFTRNGLLRVYGGFGEPNPFAAYVVALALTSAGIALLSGNLSPRRRLAFAGLAGLAGVILILTQSRGAFLGALAGATALGFLWLRAQTLVVRRLGIALAAPVAAAGITGIALLAPWDDLNAETTPANFAEQERTAHWGAALAMIKEHPLTGVGGGGYTEVFRGNTTDWRFRISRGHAHSAYLQVASEAGLPALLAYSAFLGSMILALAKRLDRNSGLCGAALAMTAALVVHGFFDYLNVLSLGILYSGLWALALASGDGRPGEYNRAI